MEGGAVYYYTYYCRSLETLPFAVGALSLSYSQIRLMVHRTKVRSTDWFKAGPERNRGSFRKLSRRVVQFADKNVGPLSGWDGTYIANRDMHGKVDHVKTNEPYVEWGSLEFA